MNKQPTPPPVDGSFVNLVQQHRQSQMLNEIGQAIRSITDAALLTGKPGGITIKLVFNPTQSGAIEIADDIKVIMPKAKKPSTLFFLHEGTLVRNNPNQLEMPLREVESAPVDVETLRSVAQ